MKRAIRKPVALLTSLTVFISLFAYQGAVKAEDGFTSQTPGAVPVYYTLLSAAAPSPPVYTYLKGAAAGTGWDTLYRVYGAFDGGSPTFFNADKLGSPTDLVALKLSEEADAEHFEYALPANVPEYYTERAGEPAIPKVYDFKIIGGGVEYRVYGKVAGSGNGSGDAEFFTSDVNGVPSNRTPLNQTNEANNAFNSGVGSQIADDLTPNEAYIQKFTAVLAQDGTPDVQTNGTNRWDADNAPGNDSGPKNGVVRSFDDIQYTLNYTTALQNQSTTTYFRKGDMYVKFILPDVAPTQATFNLDAMKWALDPVITTNTSEEGDSGINDIILTAHYRISADAGMTAIPGEGELSAGVKVLGMKNNAEIAPIFYAWLDDDSPNGSDIAWSAAPVGDNRPQVVDNLAPVRVSATPAKLNVSLHRNTDLDYKKPDGFDFGSGNPGAPNHAEGVKMGRMYGYGLILELRNVDRTRKLKGIELPDGPITFDIDLTVKKNDVDITGTKTGEILPLLWEYMPNNSSGLNGRNISWGTNTPNYLYAPASVGSKTEKENVCADGGKWMISQNGSTMKVTVSDYSFINSVGEYQWPLRNLVREAGSAPDFGEDVGRGVFSTGYFQLMFPMPEEVDETSNFSLTVADVNLKAGSIGDPAPVNRVQPVVTDDSVNYNIATTKKGSYTNNNSFTEKTQITNPWLVDLSSAQNAHMGADGWTALGSEVRLWAGINVRKADTDYENFPFALNIFQKFDSRVFQPVPSSVETPAAIFRNEDSLDQKGHLMDFRLRYVSKADGSDWGTDEITGDNEMEECAEDAPGLKFYPTMQALIDDKLPGGGTRKCVAVLVEGRGGKIGGSVTHIGFNVNVTDNTDYIGYVAQTTSDIRLWKQAHGEQMTWEDSRLPGGARSPVNLEKPDWRNDYLNHLLPPNDILPYVKTEYDANGQVKPGTHGPASYQSGASLKLVGIEATVAKTVDQRNSENSGAKKTYFVNSGERRVDYVLTPKVVLAGGREGKAAVPSTVTITDTLPARVNVSSATKYWMGGTYVPNPGNPNGGEYSSVGATELHPETVHNSATGVTTLTFTIDKVIAGAVFGQGGLAPIHYSATLGNPGGKDITQAASKDADEVANNEQFVNTATIQATGDGRAISSRFGNLATYSISTVRLGQAALIKTVKEQVVETEAAVEFNVTHQNLGETDYSGYRMLDVLSVNKEARGSLYHGGFNSRGIEISFPKYAKGTTKVNVYELKASMLAKTDGNTVLDVITASLPAPSLSDISGSGSKTSFPLKEDTAAVYVTGVLGGGDSYNLRVILEPTGNAGRDIYFNDATATTSALSTNEYILAPPVASTVVYRTVSGRAWLDSNADGIQDAGEPALANVTAVLRHSTTGAIAADRLGKPATVSTGPDGKYEFTNLSAGTYYVSFEDNKTIFKLADYGVSPKNRGSNAEKDSDVTAEFTGTPSLLSAATTDSITLPTKESVSPYGYHVRNMDAGFTLGSLAISKVSSANHATPLAGAKFTLTKDGNAGEIRTIETDTHGKATITDLKMGAYTLTETAAPAGYQIENPASQSVIITDSDMTVSLTIENTPSPPTSNPPSNPPHNPPSNPPSNPPHNPPSNPPHNPPNNPPANPPASPPHSPPSSPSPSPSNPPNGSPSHPSPSPSPSAPMNLPPPAPGNSITPGYDDTTYIEIDENGTPQGEWHWDDDTGEWVFEDYSPPLQDFIPKTGDTILIALWGSVCAAGAMMVLLCFISVSKINRRRKR